MVLYCYARMIVHTRRPSGRFTRFEEVSTKEFGSIAGPFLRLTGYDNVTAVLPCTAVLPSLCKMDKKNEKN